MDSFNKRSADIFGALDKLEPKKREETDKSTSGGEFKRPCGVYTPPSKRSKTGPDHRTSHSLDTHRSERQPTHRDHHRHTRHHHHGYSHDSKRRGHIDPQRDPSKWTKYDLKDDGTRQLSGLSDEQINRQVAYQFLDKLKQRDKPKEEELASTDKKIVFKKPTRSRGGTASGAKTTSTHSSTVLKQSAKLREEIQDDEVTETDSRESGPCEETEDSGMVIKKSPLTKSECDSTASTGGVRVMPEYVVGMSGRGRRKRSLRTLASEETGSDNVRGCGPKVEGGGGATSTKQSSIVLSHLEDYED